ncbi:MAG TPA: GNAT family N-acetyltransferase [Burkholderiales bacterium]|nr:GNAT family N-acetyltransferase [Burkholderiales bacterium]
MIRPYRTEDNAAVVALFRQFMAELTPADMKEEFAEYVEIAIRDELGRVGEYYASRPRQGFWVAELGGRVVGMIGIEKREEHVAEVRRMAVETSHRRRGIGRALLAAAEAFSRESGYEKIQLSTSERQEAARRLYESNGYRLLGTGVASRTTHKLIGGITRFYYEKRL